MRIHIKGTDKYSFVDVEYDVLLSTPVMNVKVRIMNQYSIQPIEQQFTYKGNELTNMECILNCGVQPGEHIVLAPAQHLVTVIMHYGKEEIKVDVKPTATILGLKNLLYTKTQQKIDVNRLIAIFDNGLLEDTVMISTLPALSSQPIYFTYSQLKFQIQLTENAVSTITKDYTCSIGDLRQSISKLSQEDSNLLVLEKDGDVIDFEDTVLLYQADFLESNVITVTFLSIGELIHRVRNLEKREKQQETQQIQRQQLVEKCHDITKHNNATIKQLRSAFETNTVKQEQQLANLLGTLNMLKQRIDVVTPRFEEIDELKKTNEVLKKRIDEVTQKHSRDSLSTETESALTTMQRRVSDLEKRINRITVTPQRVPATSPPPIPTSAIPKSVVKETVTSSKPVLKETGPSEPIEDDKHFMPKLRKAFAAPKIPSFVLKALHGRSRNVANDVVCTLPPYAKMYYCL